MAGLGEQKATLHESGSLPVYRFGCKRADRYEIGLPLPSFLDVSLYLIATTRTVL
ncbi:hypothetical protein EC9_31800 [Rosistilla ulvae]|uniref:Uncharacterized protein n=1 Tax=Rosistilla ulvae TaxID=1930277 RepID=A0A517M281_9BACT|nr:hypothetical protein EC9_31800 [Rosistilla ulvae]